MARKAYKEALGVNVLAKFAEGFMTGQKNRRELEQMAAERLLKQEQDARDADLKEREFKLKVKESGRGSRNIYYDAKGDAHEAITPGLSLEDQNQLIRGRRGKSVPEGTFAPPLAGAAPEPLIGKTTIQRPPTNKRLKTTKSRFLADPEKYAEYDVVDDTPKGNGMTPDKRFALDTAKLLMRDYVTNGSLNAKQASLLAEVSKNLDVSVIPEEDKGVVAFIQKVSGNPQYNLVPGAANPAPAPAATQPQVQTIRVKHKTSGQTGTIPANEFDPNIYVRI
jgi:hypothetical protein